MRGHFQFLPPAICLSNIVLEGLEAALDADNLGRGLAIERRIGRQLMKFGQLGFQGFDPLRQVLQLALFFVRQSPSARCGAPTSAPAGWRPALQPATVLLDVVPQPVVITASIFLHLALAFQYQRTSDHVVKKLAVVTYQEQRARILAQEVFQQVQASLSPGHWSVRPSPAHWTAW